jgi:tRNA-dihydrouridine synthase A
MISVAPMMDWTDRHCRYFLRLVSPRAFLYTEMVTANALHYGDAESLLRYDSAEHPLAIQLGGSDPQMMAEAAGMAAEIGYDEINIGTRGGVLSCDAGVGRRSRDREDAHRYR